MNQFFYETRAHEKLKELRKEGQLSQAVRRSRAPKGEYLRGVTERFLGFVSIISRIALNQNRKIKNGFARTTSKTTLHTRKRTRYGTADR